MAGCLIGRRDVLFLQLRLKWTVATAAFAAVTAPQMITSGENNRSALEIKILTFNKLRRASF